MIMKKVHEPLAPFADDGPHEAVQQLLVGRVLHLRLHYLLLRSSAAYADVDVLGRTAQPVVLPDGGRAHVRPRRHQRNISPVDVVVRIPTAVQHEPGEQPVVAVRNELGGGRERQDELLCGLAEQELLRQHAEGGAGGVLLLVFGGCDGL